MMTDRATPVLRVEQLCKEYRLYDSPGARLRSLLFGHAAYRTQQVLKDVNFDLYRGQCLGVVGNNGAGKSSLLNWWRAHCTPPEANCSVRVG